jgi:hypothetical protein
MVTWLVTGNMATMVMDSGISLAIHLCSVFSETQLPFKMEKKLYFISKAINHHICAIMVHALADQHQMQKWSHT